MVKNAIKLVLWGQEGVGKTTAASLFPNPWFIDTERSTKWMPELQSRQWHPAPKNWADIVEQVARFKRELPGDTLVIDTGDWMESMLIKHLGFEKGWGNLGGNNDFGKSYNDLDQEFREFLNELNEINDMGITIVITAHMEIKTCTFPDMMGSFDRYQLKMQKKTSSALKEWADCILFLKFKDLIVAEDKNGKKFKGTGGNIREFKTVHSATWDAKNRFGFPESMPFIDKKLPAPLHDLIYEGYTPGPSAMQQPKQEPAPEPINVQPDPEVQQIAHPFTQETTDTSWKDGVDPRLVDLMLSNGIKEYMVREAVGLKQFFGPYSKNIPIRDYPPAFVEEMLIGKWEGFMNIIRENNIDVPF